MTPSNHYRKRESWREKFRRGLANVRRGGETSPRQEVFAGAMIGCGACAVLASPYSPLIAALAAVIGLFCGAVIGLVLCCGSANLPDDPVLPPAPGNERWPAARRCGGAEKNHHGEEPIQDAFSVSCLPAKHIPGTQSAVVKLFRLPKY